MSRFGVTPWVSTVPRPWERTASLPLSRLGTFHLNNGWRSASSFPTDLLTSTSGATAIAGNGLDQILTEEAQFAEDAEAAAAAARTGLIIGAVAAVAIVVGIGGLIYLTFGREPRVDYDREYEQEPPSDLTPAEVGALLTQGGVSREGVHRDALRSHPSRGHRRRAVASDEVDVGRTQDRDDHRPGPCPWREGDRIYATSSSP